MCKGELDLSNSLENFPWEQVLEQEEELKEGWGVGGPPTNQNWGSRARSAE